MDVACLVRHVYPDNQVCVQWINQGYVESWLLSKQVSFIGIGPGWFKAVDTDVKCFRDCEWEKI